MKTIYFAGGCFWGVQHFFSLLNGVSSTISGYANCDIANPTYPQVKAHATTAAETVQVSYDPAIITLDELLDLFFTIIDPTTLDRQKEDVGHQYRTGIYYLNPAEKIIIEKHIQKEQVRYNDPLVTEVLPLENFYPAEEYHQYYLVKNPQGYCHLPLSAFEIARNYKKDS